MRTGNRTNARRTKIPPPFPRSPDGREILAATHAGSHSRTHKLHFHRCGTRACIGVNARGTFGSGRNSAAVRSRGRQFASIIYERCRNFPRPRAAQPPPGHLPLASALRSNPEVAPADAANARKSRHLRDRDSPGLDRLNLAVARLGSVQMQIPRSRY